MDVPVPYLGDSVVVTAIFLWMKPGTQDRGTEAEKVRPEVKCVAASPSFMWPVF